LCEPRGCGHVYVPLVSARRADELKLTAHGGGQAELGIAELTS
jgi:hypothetical protein